MKTNHLASLLALGTAFTKCSGATIIVPPPTLPFAGQGCVNERPAPATGWPGNPNINVLQAAIDSAMAGDTIQLQPGNYYFECNVYVNKPLTILGACSGVALTVDALNTVGAGSTRASCTAAGETFIVADKDIAFNGLQGIFIRSSNVVIDGLAFREAGTNPDSKWRGMINVLDQCGGSFTDIRIQNNYMVGERVSNVYPIGGTTGGKCLIRNLSYDGNFLKSLASTPGQYDPLGVRGTDPFGLVGPQGTVTLENFVLRNNILGCNTNSPPQTNCQVFRLANNFLTGTTEIAFNNLYDDDNVDDNNCPFRTSLNPIPLQDNNINLLLDECSSDEDGDGVDDNDDLCPGTPENAIVDENGCSDDQKEMICMDVSEGKKQSSGKGKGKSTDKKIGKNGRQANRGGVEEDWMKF